MLSVRGFLPRLYRCSVLRLQVFRNQKSYKVFGLFIDQTAMSQLSSFILLSLITYICTLCLSSDIGRMAAFEPSTVHFFSSFQSSFLVKD